MRRLILLPSWILYRMIYPSLNDSHPLKDETITLKKWRDNSTFLNYFISILFWVEIILLAYLLIIPADLLKNIAKAVISMQVIITAVVFLIISKLSS